MQVDESSSSADANQQTTTSSEENNNNNSTTTTTEANLSPISCAPCRKAHKRCDRKLPSCTKCIQRGVDCFYNEPKKRGKASDSYRQKKRIKQDGSELKQIVSYYYSFISGGYPVLPKAKLQLFITEYLQPLENGDEPSLTPSTTNSATSATSESTTTIQSETELNALYALFLSIKSIYYQLNENLSLAMEQMNQCEEYLGKLLVKSMHFYIYACCQQVAVFYSGLGDLSKVRFYDTMVNYYLNGNEKTHFDKYEKNMKLRMTCLSKWSTDFIDEYSGFLKKMPNFFENSVARKLQDLLLPGTLEYLQLAPKTMENYAFFKKVTEFTYKVMGQYHADVIREMTDCHCEAFFKFEQMHRIIMYHGFHLYYLLGLPDITPQLEEVALKITNATDESDGEGQYFQFTIPEVILPVKGAAMVHFNICKLIESGKRRNGTSAIGGAGGEVDYYLVLRRDVVALESLRKRYPARVDSLLQQQGEGSLLDNMKNLLKAHDESLLLTTNNNDCCAVVAGGGDGCGECGLRQDDGGGGGAIIENNDLEPLSSNNEYHANDDSNSDQSNDLTRTDDQRGEGEEKWKSLISYLEAVTERLGDSNIGSSGGSTNGDQSGILDVLDYSIMDHNAVDLDQFI